jgi:acylphosphatase
VAGEAATRGVTGYVRNLDRSDELEAILCGAVDAVDELLDRLRTGPRSARVVGIELTPLEPAPEYTGFDIRY